MNDITWKKYKKICGKFRKYTETMAESLPNLKSIQQKFVNSRNESPYKIETPVVYNSALDEVTVNDEIKLILIADNPGRREQMTENKRYLIGPSGKIANKFFLNNPALGIDFLKNVIILNKTPVHTPRTIELRELCRNKEIEKAMEESQKEMASLLFEFHVIFDCPVWITGYSEMRKGGVFEAYTEKIKELYRNKSERIARLFIYRHFSMNQFTIDLKQQSLPEETITESLCRIGAAYRKRILAI